jgi:hypothetical protein
LRDYFFFDEIQDMDEKPLAFRPERQLNPNLKAATAAGSSPVKKGKVASTGGGRRKKKGDGKAKGRAAMDATLYVNRFPEVRENIYTMQCNAMHYLPYNML